jgi:methionine-rich copper-binding protein CopC
MARRLWTSVLVIAAAATMMTLVTPLRPAAAETKIVATTPSDHGSVASPISRITLTFDEKIDGAKGIVAVTGPGGGRMEAGSPKISGYELVQQLRMTDLRGGVTVGWRVDMPSGQIVTGSFAYEVASGGSMTPPTDPPSVIASALAEVTAESQPDGASAATTTTAGTDAADVWWKRPWAAAAGAIALLLLAGVAVVNPARSRRG